MRVNNVVMLNAGLAPASVVARALGKNLSTVHRLASGEFVKYTRDGRALYIDLASLEAYYTGNTPMQERVRKLRQWVNKHSSPIEAVG